MSIKKTRRAVRSRLRFGTLLMAAAFGVLLCGDALSQNGTSSGGNVYVPSWGGSCPQGNLNDGNCSYYSWQIAAGNGSTTNYLTSEMGIKGPSSPGPTQVLIKPIPTRTGGTTVHEAHGNIAFTVWSPATCGSGSVIAQVRDQNGNTIAGVYLVGVGLSSVSSYNIPIKVNLATALPITALQLETDTNQCGAVTISWSLVME